MSAKVLITGAGAIVKKMSAAWQRCEDLDIELHVVDIMDSPAAKESLPSSTRFYNWKDPAQLRQLIDEGWEDPFDCAYLSTFPSAHMSTALRLDFIVKNFIFPKPVDSHFEMLDTIYFDHVRGGALNVIPRSCVHDHYRNKPLTTYLKGHMHDLHHRNGFLKNIKLYVTEHKTIQSEIARRQSLECGMILDLAPHALSVIYELVPPQLEWRDREGHKYLRTDRRIELVSTTRGRDNSSMLRSQRAETFAALHFRIKEDIQFTQVGSSEPSDTLNDRQIDLLIVVGKGVSIQDDSDRRDLKAIELEFDGQFVRGNFDTNAVQGVFSKELQSRLEAHVDRRHKGLNKPLLDLAENRFQFNNLRNSDLVAPFQTFQDAFSIASLLECARTHHTAKDLVRYAPLDKVSDVINRCMSKGLDPMWAHDDEMSGLVFGELPQDPIA